MKNLVLIVVLCLTQGGCFWGLFGDEVAAKVNNKTDDTIRASVDGYYPSDIYSIQDEYIRSGKSHQFYFDNFEVDPEVEVIYKGIHRLYEVEVDFWGYDTINVETFHFVNANG